MQNCCTNNSLLPHDKTTTGKTVSSLLELIDHAFVFRICFGKALVPFDFDEKHTRSVTQRAM